jgi:adenylate kinase
MSAALELMRRGELVSDELVMSMVRERLQCLQCNGGFLLDGVPRTIQQAHALESLLNETGVSIDAVLHYELPIAEIVDRIGGRRTCSQCKAVYHITACPPAKEDVCDQCNARLIQRDDDRPEAVSVRMEAYRQATQPLTDFYAERKVLISISAKGRPDDILQQTLDQLGKQLSIAVA